jgi:hypothetical protein
LFSFDATTPRLAYDDATGKRERQGCATIVVKG